MAARPRVLVTRAPERAGALVAGVRALGGEPVCLPCLEIVDAPPDAGAAAPTGGIAIFTSREAVERAGVLGALPWPGVEVYAIGAATAAALVAHGQPLALPPVPPYTSEALLAGGLAERLEGGADASAIDSRQVTIVKGAGGRSVLADAARAAGRPVLLHMLYRRRCPVPDPDTVAHALDPLPDVLCTGSDEALVNLLALAGERATALFGIPLLVNGERNATVARELGFHGRVLVAERAGDDAQLRRLDELLRRG